MVLWIALIIMMCIFWVGAWLVMMVIAAIFGTISDLGRNDRNIPTETTPSKPVLSEQERLENDRYWQRRLNSDNKLAYVIASVAAIIAVVLAGAVVSNAYGTLKPGFQWGSRVIPSSAKADICHSNDTLTLDERKYTSYEVRGVTVPAVKVTPGTPLTILPGSEGSRCHLSVTLEDGRTTEIDVPKEVLIGLHE